MLKTKKTSKLLTALLLAAVAAVVIFAAIVPSAVNASAAAPAESASAEENAVQPRLFTKLGVNISGGNGEVFVIATNTFTLFPSTVQVYVYLYSSDTYSENYENMSIEDSSYIGDLDMGNSIEARASTDGEQKYWLSRVRYKEGNGEWKNIIVGPVFCDGNGDLV